jgi:hypothetical protein
MGWRTTTARLPCPRSSSTTRRLTAPLPQPVRTAHTATTGTRERSMVRRGPRRQRSERPAGQVHHVLVAHVAVREDDPVDAPLPDDPLELVLGQDGDAIGIAWPGQRRRIVSAADPRDLGGGEGHHLGVGRIAVHGIEVVKIAPGGAQDHDPSRHEVPPGPSAVVTPAAMPSCSMPQPTGGHAPRAPAPPRAVVRAMLAATHQGQRREQPGCIGIPSGSRRGSGSRRRGEAGEAATARMTSD